ncbi:MAG: FAD-dependent thymidylate synthase [Chloroflexi bacterium]|nr:FAD-dependent thymidylate synthase [Chloroflexota bacterium]
MQVRLVAYTPEPERTAAAAARLCYSSVSAISLLENITEPEIERLLESVIAAGHLSTIEHISFTFAIDGLSRAASHQLVRHRLASYSQQSQRYVSLKTPEYVTPPSIASKPALREAFEQAMEQDHKLYRQLQEAGIPAEDARYVLSNATTTRLVMTMNARELIHVSGLRLCRHAQWEIRRLFGKVKVEVAQVAPIIARHLQPKCLPLGYCDERETCGLRPLKTDVEASHPSQRKGS